MLSSALEVSIFTHMGLLKISEEPAATRHVLGMFS
jgi:hypothetical protein